MDIEKLKEIIKESIETSTEESLFIDFKNCMPIKRKFEKGVRTSMFEICDGCTLLLDIDNQTNEVISMEFV
jgi:hypothetical protein